MRDTHRERQRHKQREKQAPCREPDVGLHPRSHPEPKAVAQPLSHPGIPGEITVYVPTLSFAHHEECILQIQYNPIYILQIWS